MKKNILFGMLTLLLAGFGFGGISMASDVVAKIGDATTCGTTSDPGCYETFEAAFAAAVDGDTIYLLENSAGNGIKAPQGKFTNGLTVDFGGYTYTMDGTLVGSTGTETQAFQLLKDNKITFKNGTIYSEKAKMLVQNYSNLTLENMTLILNNVNYAYAYTLSNNNGNIVIDDTIINANPAGGFAFDVCRYASYPSVHVTVQGESVINGNVEISASANDAMDGFSLTLQAGTMNGDIVVDSSAATAIKDTPTKAEVVKTSSFSQAAPTGYAWVKDSDTYKIARCVASIGVGDDINCYETFEAAFAAAVDGDTIYLLENSAGNGIKAPQGKFTNGLTVDFGGYTYTMDGTLVGSTGTETQAFQLLKDNKITFKNGTIYSEKAKMLVQNYSNLTLENMVLTLNNVNYAYAYTLSNNNGDIVIDNTTINANPAGGFAFDVCRYASYPSVHVTVQGESVINGDVEISASANDAMDGFSLTLQAGTMSGDIVVDPSAATAIKDTPTKAEVVKTSSFSQNAPTGYIWNTDGKLVESIKVSFNVNGGSSISDIEIEKGTKLTTIQSTTRNGYSFDGWYYDEGLTNVYSVDDVFNEDKTLYAKWKYIPQSGGGSSSSKASNSSSSKASNPSSSKSSDSSSSNSPSTSDDSDTSDTTSNQDDDSTTSDIILKGQVEEESKNEVDVVISDTAKSNFNEEQLNAYKWSYKNRITTINDTDKARLSDPLTRAELAKMMSQYISSVLKKDVLKTDAPNYSDVDNSLGDLADYIQKAYQYQIMGINADGTSLKEFNPHRLVTRAEFATVFSRVLFGNKYNQSEGAYYEKHIAALKEAGILSNNTPTIQEVRGWVMLMMYRSAVDTNKVSDENAPVEEVKDEEKSDEEVGLANPASVYCIEQGGEIEIREETDGAQYGVCKFKDGTEVEEREYYRNNHKDEAATENTTGSSASTGNVTQ